MQLRFLQVLQGRRWRVSSDVYAGTEYATGGLERKSRKPQMMIWGEHAVDPHKANEIVIRAFNFRLSRTGRVEDVRTWLA